MSPVDPRDHATAHSLDALSAALDGALPEDERRDALERVRSCPECRAAYEAMAWTRAQAARLAAVDVPPDLDDRLRAALERKGGRPRPPLLSRRTLGLGLAAVVLLALAAALLRLVPAPTALPTAVAADFRARAVGERPLALHSGDPARVEAWLAQAGLGFPTRVLDLGMMGYELRGADTLTIDGRRSAVLVYRETSTGRDVVCQMLAASLADIPPPDRTHTRNGIPFHVYDADGLTLVFWPEGDVLCVLAGDGDPDALVELALAKAMKARPDEA